MVEVAEIVTEVSGYLQFGPPKTRAGYRRVGLPRVVVQALAEQLARPGSADDQVFVGPQGGTLRLAGFRHRIWRPPTSAAGLDGLRIHDLRHTAVALWIAAGANPKEAAARAGHTSVSFTWTATAASIRTPIRRSGTAWMPCMRSPRHARRQVLTDQRRARRAARGPMAHRKHPPHRL
jgi:integrase